MTPLTWPQILRSLLAGTDLSAESATWAMTQILDGEATDVQVAGFVTALRAKGETPVEVRALVEVMLAHANRVNVKTVVLDVVGTGGDNSHSVNISTMSAIVAAAAGVPVVKHGNRAASSSTGTADVLEELGVVIDLTPELVEVCAENVGIAFCFAPLHHPAMRYAVTARRELGVPTVFNLLGPLTNPALAQSALIGCADKSRAPVMADVLERRGVKAIVVHGADGLDEISTSAFTHAWDVTGTGIREVAIDPRELGIEFVSAELITGGNRVRNAELLRKTLSGVAVTDADADRVAAIRDAVALNAAAALVAYDAATGAGEAEVALMERLRQALPRSRAILETGAGSKLLDRWIEMTRSLKP
ncbi:MAG: anthranilate phosphoribosyltransferase [Actinomycetota bacterium]|nr:anthranilate phosphoribosyltransferase [Actinomycetota bacterium]